jgi:3-oxoacyl-[acyl-carrier protein] reductase
MKLKDKVAIVTGSGRGIGRATALELAKEGANVVATARTEEEIKRTSEEIKEFGREAISVRCDVRSSNDIKNLVRKTIEKFGRIDVLVNNAGVAIYKPLVEITEEEWKETIDINLKGAFLCSREVLPVMVRQNSGIIVNISSGLGKIGAANFSAYCAAKFGVIGLTEALAKEVEDKGIRVYAVCPRAVDTKLYYDIFPGTDPSYLSSPEDIAKEVVKLCLPGCKVKTGKSIDVGDSK